jgi:hypothetical protein
MSSRRFALLVGVVVLGPISAVGQVPSAVASGSVRSSAGSLECPVGSLGPLAKAFDCGVGLPEKVRSHGIAFASKRTTGVQACADLSHSTSVPLGALVQATANASAQWSDHFTPVAPPGAPALASARITPFFTGTLTSTITPVPPPGASRFAASTLQWTFSAFAFGGGQVQDRQVFQSQAPSSTTPPVLSFDVTVNYRNSFLVPLGPSRDLFFYFNFIANSQVQYVNNSDVPDDGDAVSCANFEHSAGLAGLEWLDANLNVIPGVTYTTENGTEIVVPSAVPEPRSVVLLTAGLIGVGIRLLGRKRNTK